MRSALLLLFLLSNHLFGLTNFETIDIGILDPENPRIIQVIPEMGAYVLIADGQNLGKLGPTDRVSFALTNGSIKVVLEGQTTRYFKDIRLMALNDESFFRIYLLSPVKEERVYDDHLIIKPLGKEIRLINRVDLEKYVAGVVEAESGKEKGLEFYKVQAIISRTYALSNKRRFLAKGFNLNDQVDCQVYHGKSRWEPEILEAVRITQGLVLVDSEMNLITTAFHSNSGGETVSSELVWTKNLPYLNPRKDEFSLQGDHYAWRRSIHKNDWLEYLRAQHGLDVGNGDVLKSVTSFKQPHRQVYFAKREYGILLKQIRQDWVLNSTFFDLELAQDSVIFEGRGFGHGIGLSQEGAMRMSNIGFSYFDILNFYYDDVHVIDLRALEFFREE
jgi:stage II sporulation protein D